MSIEFTIGNEILERIRNKTIIISMKDEEGEIIDEIEMNLGKKKESEPKINRIFINPKICLYLKDNLIGINFPEGYEIRDRCTPETLSYHIYEENELEIAKRILKGERIIDHWYKGVPVAYEVTDIKGEPYIDGTGETNN